MTPSTTGKPPAPPRLTRAQERLFFTLAFALGLLLQLAVIL